MGRRMLLVKQETIGQILQPRGKDFAILLRICGPDIPADARTISFNYIPEIHCMGLLLESAEWSDLQVVGRPAIEEVNGIQLLPAKANFHATIVGAPAIVIPGCAVPGYDCVQSEEASSIVSG